MWLNPPRTPIATSTRLKKTDHPCRVYPFHSYPSKKQMILRRHASWNQTSPIKTSLVIKAFAGFEDEQLSHNCAVPIPHTRERPATPRLQFYVLPKTLARLRPAHTAHTAHAPCAYNSAHVTVACAKPKQGPPAKVTCADRCGGVRCASKRLGRSVGRGQSVRGSAWYPVSSKTRTSRP